MVGTRFALSLTIVVYGPVEMEIRVCSRQEHIGVDVSRATESRVVVEVVNSEGSIELKYVRGVESATALVLEDLSDRIELVFLPSSTV